jgi:hypothetical protein
MQYTAIFAEKLNVPVEYFQPTAHCSSRTPHQSGDLAASLTPWAKSVGLVAAKFWSIVLSTERDACQHLKWQSFNQTKPYFLTTHFRP